jgi:PAS domain S-box-containing protein
MGTLPTEPDAAASQRTASEKPRDWLSAREQFRITLDAAPTGMIMIDPQGRIVLANAHANKLFGYNPAELIGQPIEALLPDRLRKNHSEFRNHFFKNPQSRLMGAGRDLYGRRKDGSEVAVEIGLNPVETPEGTFVLSSVVDITERKLMEAGLRESEERFRLVANTAPVMIWMSGTDKLCTFFNQGWLEFTGRSMEQQMGQGWSSGVHPNDLSTCLKIYSEAFDARTEFKMEYRLRRFDGEFRWIVDSGTPRYAPDGSFQGYIGSCIDITESKLNQEELQKSLRFEMLLTELSARFVAVTAETIDTEIVNALRQIVLALDLDRCTLAQRQDDERYVVTHTWAQPGFDPFPGFAAKDLPWIASAVNRGEEIRYTNFEDLPGEAWRDKEVLRRFGSQSVCLFPFKVGGNIIGGVAFGTIDRERIWSDAVVNRLRVFVEIIGNAVARTRAEEAARKALDEVERLRKQLQRENIYLQEEIKAVRGRAGLIGESPALRHVLGQVEQVAATDANVLLVGETGTGKEMIASAIHELSLRGSRPMVKVSCAAIPETLIESELFGREKGAYTGALSRQIGRFELAHGSTLFLDEIGELPLEVQVKLLRVLEERQIARLGSSKSIAVDLRIIAATNRDLHKAVREQKFRDDLFYRLNVFPIHTPALRERPEDIPLLVQSFVQEFAASFGKHIENVDQTCIDALQRYPWPGNIRELRNAVERSMILATGPLLQINPPSDYPDLAGAGLSYVDAEREHVRDVLEMTAWRIRGKGGAAEILGVKPTTLDSRIARLGLTRSKDDKAS